MAWFKKARKPIAATAEPKRAACPKGCGSSVPAARRSSTTRISPPTCNVCPKCAHHFRISAAERLRMLFDGDWTEHDRDLVSTDPLSSPTPSRTRRALKAELRPPPASRTPSSSRSGTHRRHPADRRGDGVRVHRRQHGRRRRREDHAGDRAGDRRSAVRSSSSAARAARA